ncbi:hypothetical protein QSV08_17695 [Maribacter sp. BPC-D8]|uniref:hypothetical protein n=1 Tax=Maribacter sp. BPC-D8 TaxID=3053613 RepID=UPI002B47ED86|nr:hypothetical protein [Maribacter sp. BPC-D8]WRI29043.1 hypothetical protein QSV08_17695 [Maribacter sp. BPC-D8]
MKYFGIGEGSLGWQLYCSQEEIARLQLDTHLQRNRERWENPKPIQLYVDTNVPDHEALNFNEPILRNTMLWSSGGGSRKWHKAAFTPFTRGICISDQLFKVLNDFTLTEDQFLELKVDNYQKKTQYKYWLFYPIKQWNFPHLSIENSIFKKINKNDKDNITIVKASSYEELLEIKKANHKNYEFIPSVLGLNKEYDFLFDGYTFIVSERLRNAIEEAGMTDVFFYDLDYEVIVNKEN